jgi:DNA-binding transcriptional LysR family regulator
MESDPWLGVEVRHLAALQAVARHASFGRAAQALGYTQSAVSQQIAALERAVGERLVERPGGPRPVSLTEAGELLLGHAERIMARLAAARADLAALSDGELGTLRIGTFQSVGAKVLPTLLARFGAAWPRVEVGLRESATDDDLLESVRGGELDLAFAMLPLPEGPYETVELLSDPYVLVVSCDSPLVEAPALDELAELPLVGARLCRSLPLVERHLHAAGVQPRFVFQSDDNGTVQGMVAAGVGAALVPLLTVDTTDPRVRVLDLGGAVPSRRIVLAWHRDRYRSPAARAFAEAAQVLCSELQDRLSAAAV